LIERQAKPSELARILEGKDMVLTVRVTPAADVLHFGNQAVNQVNLELIS